MEEFQINYHVDVTSHDLPILDRATSKKIKASIETKLKISPEIFGTPLRATLRQYWRIRVGNYRVVYKLSGQNVFILVISHRKNVYELANKRM